MTTRLHPLRRLAAAAAFLLAAAPAAAQVLATLSVNQQRLQGTAPGGQLLLYTPDPLEPGSSVSHWDPTATPNLLMEPAISPDLPFLGLDVTPGLMHDLGWQAGTSSFNIVPLDPPGAGFTDPRPFPGAPGNPATTLGEARVNLFNAVLGAWASTLESSVDIDVLVTWQPLFCEPGVGAVLAAASTTFVFRDGPAFPHPGVWYHSALAEALDGTDLSGPPEDNGGDIIVFVNSDIDEGCLGEGTGYYYGVDGNQPPELVDVAPVVLHEVGHGLGMSNFSDESDGSLFQGYPSIFDLFTFDTTTGKSWDTMSNAERVASAVNVRRVVWSGVQANAAAAPLLTPGVPELTIASPAEVAGSYEIGLASFGPPLPAGGVNAQIACLTDGVVDPAAGDSTLLNGCTPATNPTQLAGRIALVDRGGCTFVSKAANAQAAGAVGVVVVNNAGNTPIVLGGSDDSITIPVVSVGRGDGNRIRQAACPGAAAFVRDGRFQVTARWAIRGGQSGPGVAHPLTADTTYFTFFDDDNVELTVKVLDACTLPDFESFWVFAAGLTNVEVTLTVTDTQTGQAKSYFNPLDTTFQPILDTVGFDTCP